MVNDLRLHQARLLASSVRTMSKRALKSNGPKRRHDLNVALRCAQTLEQTIKEITIK